MEGSKKQLLKWTKQFWQARAQKALSDEDVSQPIKSITGFFKILKEWQEKENDQTTSSGK